MMWQIIRRNQLKSLILLIIMGVILILLGYIFGFSLVGDESGAFGGIVIALIIYFILLLVSLSSGKNIMLSMANARRANPSKYQQLYNIVEEMRLAAGMSAMPEVYVIDDPAPNAFAAGMNPRKSAVAVTTGLLQSLNRDELQGVIAHEISHIINRDIRYMTLAIIMVGTVAIISEIFLRSILYGSRQSRSSSGRGGQGQAILLIIAIAFAIIAPFLIRILYFALSRKREYLADACGARLTRYPEGLASALEKIASSTYIYELKGANNVNAPMYIANPFKPKRFSLRNLFSTHPPIEERIRILRSMGKNFSFENYQAAYREVTNKRAIIPKSTLLSEANSS